MMKRLPLSLTLQLVICIPVAIILLATYLYLAGAITELFRDFQIAGGQMRAGEIVELLTNYYDQNGSWNGVPGLIRSKRQLIEGEVTERNLMLVEVDGKVIASSSEEMLDRYIDEATLSDGIPIFHDGNLVGRLLIGPVIDNFSPREQDFLYRTQQMLLLTGLAGVMIAMITGAIFLRRALTPLRQLSKTVRGLQSDRYGEKTDPRSTDEIGELTIAIEEMTAHLKRSEENRQNMMHDISQEIRTPLTALQCNLEAIQDGITKPTPESIASLLDQTILLTRLVDELRQLALLEAGEIHLHIEPVNVAQILQQLKIVFRPQFCQRAIELSLHVPENLALVAADTARATQVLINLLSNAQRYTPENGKIVIKASDLDEHIQVSISDTGRGIPQSELSQIFHRFYRLDGPKPRSSVGSGLGLSIAKRLMEAQGGKIWADSIFGQGATFYLLFPKWPRRQGMPSSASNSQRELAPHLHIGTSLN